VTRARSLDWPELIDWCAARGLTLSAAQIEQLSTYLDTLVLWNRKLALVSQSEPEKIISKHLADSLFAASCCRDGEAVVDLGSGAGFPGLPIAVARPSSLVCLIESRGKKASFLEQACRAAGARNAVVCNGRIEAVAADPDHRGRYAVATARALTSTTEFLALAAPFLVVGGRAIAMRSTNEDPAQDPPGVAEVRYELPDGTPRRLLIAGG
jgi:16S rRNA (guanine527-N7)-methyltransferase